MKHTIFHSRRAAAIGLGLAASAAALLFASFAAQAGNFPAGREDRDSVTGYLCVGTCSTVRLPNADCICQKVNPGETDVRRLKLKCWGMEHGSWVACPVKPRYGISVN
ncbi:MAG: hypothetical protein BGN87_19510 [Rhizobiales bacterium 65-79]|jgi:hypothetical protein|nr:hypothetical protein [Hyphomicrobiales bacterium]OJU02013.1 MAG: hypothetical protein BGN87_19510 [Rhizobiales bacterium 65-79]